MTDGSESTIVVGVDGSVPSIDALRWAARQAEATRAALHVVTAWTFPNEPTPFDIVPDLPLNADQLAEVESKLNDAIRRVVPAEASTEVTAKVVTGRASAVLIEESRGADLLVVGNRGRGALAEALLGSVSEHCVRHALCPVVVIRGHHHP
jgi:nucleotide-binding universal stress UspA family protein